MAATKSQGTSFTLFVCGLTAVCAGIAYFSSGTGKMALLLGLIALTVAAVGFLKTKELEGKTGVNAQPAVMKLLGLLVVLGGWVVVLGGLHLTSAAGARLATSLIGLAISFAGIFFILAPASSKNAIWKV